MSENTRRLLWVWAMLMLLTASMAIIADVTNASRLNGFWLTGVAAVTVVKARFVLSTYLGLARTPAALVAFTAAIALTMAVITGAVLAS